ncbi:MAG: hypothetical protein JSW50_13775 [Candidatus Latescibacterota bacterium]|nr:MAG: hypothetical protein JSW50_13775 [Candidatus Latescibacterota bacterium]
MIKRFVGILVAGLLAAMLASPEALAQTEDPENKTGGDAETGERAEEGRHEAGLFVGITSEAAETGLSIGLAYEFRIDSRFGIGGVGEATGADFREGILAAAFYWHPWQGELKFIGAPGIVFKPKDKDAGFVFRLGGEYGIAFKPMWKIAPGLYIDFTSDDTAVVIGATIVRSFGPPGK